MPRVCEWVSGDWVSVLCWFGFCFVLFQFPTHSTDAWETKPNDGQHFELTLIVFPLSMPFQLSFNWFGVFDKHSVWLFALSERFGFQIQTFKYLHRNMFELVHYRRDERLIDHYGKRFYFLFFLFLSSFIRFFVGPLAQLVVSRTFNRSFQVICVEFRSCSLTWMTTRKRTRLSEWPWTTFVWKNKAISNVN